jgi:hypothetical protein
MCSEWPVPYFQCDGKRIPAVSRFYADTIHVVLPCGYRQKFWHDLSDTQAIYRTAIMKKRKIKTA